MYWCCEYGKWDLDWDKYLLQLKFLRMVESMTGREVIRMNIYHTIILGYLVVVVVSLIGMHF